VSLTPLQRSRIEYHLDLDSLQGLLALSLNIRSSTLSDSRLLSVVGNLSTAPTAEIYTHQGQSLATTESALGRCERAFDKLSPTTIDDSLLVSKAGKVVLRKDELKARRQLYREAASQLAQAMGYTDSTDCRAQLWG